MESQFCFCLDVDSTSKFSGHIVILLFIFNARRMAIFGGSTRLGEQENKLFYRGDGGHFTFAQKPKSKLLNSFMMVFFIF